MTNNEFEEVQRLIRLKRFESPGEEYYQSFAERFKERQRSELLRRSARSILLERLAMWFEEGGGLPRLVPAGAIAAAAVGFGTYWLLPGGAPVAESPILASADGAAASLPGTAQSAPLSARALDEISLDSAEAFELSLPRVETGPDPVRPSALDGGSGFGFSFLPVGSKGGLREL
jgi:hypothetical protein